MLQVDKESNEIAGVFESIQPSDTDLGSKVRFLHRRCDSCW